MAEHIPIDRFMALSSTIPMVDVRAPAEYADGHIPGAVNIPLFSDQERREVGRAYKQINKEAAMYLGLDFAGKKLVSLAKHGERVAGNKKTLLVHCWRGGMRSRSMVWLFETLGVNCYLLEGGYKSYRSFVRSVFSQGLQLRVIGGRTGSGKTDILKLLQARGEQVVDLEGLAHHKGSAFGSLGEEAQPSTEQFENTLCQTLGQLDVGKPIWVEDESRNVGKCVIPGEFYEQMKASRILFLDLSRELRAEHLVKHYADYEGEELKACIQKISKKLGGDRTREALEAIDRKDFYQSAMITLHYYDKSYMFSLKKNHEEVVYLPSDTIDAEKNANLLIRYVGENEN